MEIERCFACPRKCGADRQKTKGVCNSDNTLRIASFGLHKWEEPCICGENGSGTVFFSGCTLKCVFCQNYQISQFSKGKEISQNELCDIMLRLQNAGAHNINLVNPTHYAKIIRNVLERIKPSLKIPVVYNTGGYDTVQTIKSFEGLIDIWLPDIKYYDSRLSLLYSGIENYFEYAINAVKEMYNLHTKRIGQKQNGYMHSDNVYDPNGGLQSGVIIRHLCLPGQKSDTMTILEKIKENFGAQNTCISLMSQYFPTYRAKEYKQLNRRLTTLEYQKIVDYAVSLGFENGFTQQKSSACKDYVPNFDLLNPNNI